MGTSRASSDRSRGSARSLDPVADKLIVATALVLLVTRDTRPLVVLMAIVIIGREIAISALREWMAGLGQRRKVAVSLLASTRQFSRLWDFR